jgi:cytosine/adenosine deaminase-related metal-dependent hydrolase
LHACEGVDADSHEELWELDRLGLLDSSTILVHGLAIDAGGIALMRERQASLIACPSSNSFLFETLPDISELGAIDNVSLGNDSPLTAEGDLLDEIQFAARFCGISPETLYRMVTESPATILRLKHAEGSLTASGIADMIAIADAGLEASEMLATLRFQDIELVIIGGRVQLASGAMLERIPLSLRNGLEPLYVDATLRWVRAPVSELLRQSEEVLGSGEVRLGKRTLRTPLQLAKQT